MLKHLIKALPKYISNKEDFGDFLHLLDTIQQSGLTKITSGEMPENKAKAILLKISNYLIGKCQYQNRHEYIISSPYGLITDPSNSCPLHCPGCLHNRVFQKKIGPDWPPGLLMRKTFNDFIKKFGPFASTILFYNWGEPLLNQNTPDFIRQAKGYLLNTSLSSNLSTPFDAEKLVLSGLDYMILSVDGVTRETYKQYRQGGNFDLALDNMRRLVNAKKKHNLATPWLSWQFLLFEHNKHEMELAKKMAAVIGVNEVRFTRPYDIIWAPDLHPAKQVKEETHTVTKPGGGDKHIKTEINPSFSNLFAKKWVDKITGIDDQLFNRRSGTTCQWLYTSIVMDASGRYLPCCYVPRKNSGFSYIFAKKNGEGANPFNSEYYRFSRKHFVWLTELRNQSGIAPILGEGKSAPYCVACPNKKGIPLVNEFHLHRYLKKLDTCHIFKDETLSMITSW